MRRRRDDDLVGGAELLQAEGPFDNGDARTIGCLDKMRLCDAAQDELVVGVGIQHAVAHDAYVGMRAFGDDAVAVQHRLVGACLLRCLRIHDGRQQI